MRLLQTCYLTLLFSASSTLVFAKIDQLSQSRAQAVKDAFRHAWNGYKQYAFGHDELRPLTNGSSDTRNGWGASIFDALDTMIIMGLDDEYRLALEHVRNVNWNSTKEPSKTFETNIRYLGGLLAAYDLRPDPTLLEKALELTEQVILPAYRTPNGIPAAYVDVSKGEPILGDDLILAEFGSLQLELVRLSQITGDNKYASIANYVIHRMRDVPSNFPGLYPISWSLKNFRPSSGYITISGGGDSYYEYLLKTHLLMGGQEAVQLDMWKQSIKSMQKFLRSETDRNLVFLGELNDEYKLLQTGELVCFLPGNILMGARFLKNREMEKFATDLMKGCSEAWDLTPTGIAPETWSWIDKGQNMSGYPMALQLAMKNTGFIAQDLSYDLRPETLESLFYFYRLTGNKDYQEMAWKMFEAIEKYCKTPTGYTRIGDISNINDIHPQDFEESYFFAETMKYLYLIFSDPKLISLDDYVFNTEAHPFKLSRPVKLQARFRN